MLHAHPSNAGAIGTCGEVVLRRSIESAAVCCVEDDLEKDLYCLDWRCADDGRGVRSGP